MGFFGNLLNKGPSNDKSNEPAAEKPADEKIEEVCSSAKLAALLSEWKYNFNFEKEIGEGSYGGEYTNRNFADSELDRIIYQIDHLSEPEIKQAFDQEEFDDVLKRALGYILDDRRRTNEKNSQK